MKTCRADILPAATLRAFREAAAAGKVGEARTWLPATPAWQRTARIFWRRLWFAGRRPYSLVASRQASAMTWTRS